MKDCARRCCSSEDEGDETCDLPIFFIFLNMIDSAVLCATSVFRDRIEFVSVANPAVYGCVSREERD